MPPPFGHVGRELEALPFSAGQGGKRLPQGEVAETDIGEAPEDGVSGGGSCFAGTEECERFGDRQGENFGDSPEPWPVRAHVPSLKAFRHVPSRDAPVGLSQEQVPHLT